MTKAVISEQHVIRLASGRLLGFAEYGDHGGRPILAFHGVPGTRLMFRPTAAIAKRLGLRVIAPDRPGFGLSEPQADRSLHDWIGDVSALLAHLRLDTFSLVGISGGGPFAVATAAHFGARVRALGLVSPLGPVADVAGHIEMSNLQRRFFLGLPSNEKLANWAVRGANAIFRFAPGVQYDVFVRTLPKVDREILSAPKTKKHVLEDIRESMRFDGAGARREMVIFSEPWDVDYKRITAPAILWQGMSDTIVPVNVALELGRRIPKCRVIELLDEGHFWGYREMEEILAEVQRIGGV